MNEIRWKIYLTRVKPNSCKMNSRKTRVDCITFFLNLFIILSLLYISVTRIIRNAGTRAVMAQKEAIPFLKAITHASIKEQGGISSVIKALRT